MDLGQIVLRLALIVVVNFFLFCSAMATLSGFNYSLPVNILPSESLRNGDQFGNTYFDIIFSPDSYFAGHSIALWGNYALISATGKQYGDASNPQTGIVYAFGKTIYGWWKQQKTIVNQGSKDNAFGESVSLCDGLALIGAWKDSTYGTYSGRAFIYRTYIINDVIGFENMQSLVPQNSEAGDFFGFSVAVLANYGDYNSGIAVIGAFGHNKNGNVMDTGAVYIFTSLDGQWTQVAMLEAPDAAAFDSFGWSVAAHGYGVVVGAPDATESGGAGMGAAYVYEFTERSFSSSTVTWNYNMILKLSSASEGSSNSMYGVDVDIYNSTSGVLTVAIGACLDSTKGFHSGAVFIYSRVPKQDLFREFVVESSENNNNNKDNKNNNVEYKSYWKYYNTDTFISDNYGDYWIMEAAIYGRSQLMRIGRAISMRDGVLLAGGDMSGMGKGTAILYGRQVTNHHTNNHIRYGALRNSTWRYAATLRNTMGSNGDFFGSSLALLGTDAFVGAYLTMDKKMSSDSGSNQGDKHYPGAAYAFSSTAKPQSVTVESTSNWEKVLPLGFVGTVVFAVGAVLILIAGFLFYRSVAGGSKKGPKYDSASLDGSVNDGSANQSDAASTKLDVSERQAPIDPAHQGEARKRASKWFPSTANVNANPRQVQIGADTGGDVGNAYPRGDSPFLPNAGGGGPGRYFTGSPSSPPGVVYTQNAGIGSTSSHSSGTSGAPVVSFNPNANVAPTSAYNNPPRPPQTFYSGGISPPMASQASNPSPYGRFSATSSGAVADTPPPQLSRVAFPPASSPNMYQSPQGPGAVPPAGGGGGGTVGAAQNRAGPRQSKTRISYPRQSPYATAPVNVSGMYYGNNPSAPTAPSSTVSFAGTAAGSGGPVGGMVGAPSGVSPPGYTPSVRPMPETGGSIYSSPPPYFPSP